jgi:hypothetical protein
MFSSFIMGDIITSSGFSDNASGASTLIVRDKPSMDKMSRV